jgi:hypothetical protein
MTTYKDHEELRHYSDGDSIAVIACEGPGCRFPGCSAAAELVLAAVRAKFAAYLGDGATGPVLYPGSHESLHTPGAFVVSWEEGPFQWTYDPQGYTGIPDDVFIEPVNHWCLGVYPDIGPGNAEPAAAWDEPADDCPLPVKEPWKPLDRETAIGKLAEVHPELDRAGIEARYARYLSGFPASEPHTITRTGTYLTEDGVQSGTVVTRRPTEAELQAAFLAAKGRGKILDDDVLAAILTAAHDAAHPEGNEK